MNCRKKKKKIREKETLGVEKKIKFIEEYKLDFVT